MSGISKIYQIQICDTKKPVIEAAQANNRLALTSVTGLFDQLFEDYSTRGSLFSCTLSTPLLTACLALFV